jgi:AAA domain, putative AbiEii toxin, Type IV TA system
MRVRSLRLRNFKRFTDLTIEEIPEDTRLVLMIGANGSGKSSVFDAFEYLRVAPTQPRRRLSPYYQKAGTDDVDVELWAHDGTRLVRNRNSTELTNTSQWFYGRSSVRIVPRATQVNDAESALDRDTDRPIEYILPDQRFNTDLQAYTSHIDKELREIFIAKSEDNATRVRKEQIEPLNDALRRVFGDDDALVPQLVNWTSPSVGAAAQLEFQKGSARITYDLLSHGEKQVLILLLNFLVRKESLNGRVIFIDEMDNHLHRSLQFRLLEEISEHWIPESSQLWTATHALGFIEYASSAPGAVVIDFDELDFDQPQVLRPQPKDDPSIFNIAISRELLSKLAASRKIVFVEGPTDVGYLNAAGLDAVFLPSGNKKEAFFRAKGSGLLCLLDPDLLLPDEQEQVRTRYPHVRFVPSSCMENELYHPDNVAELAASEDRSFDIETYVAEWVGSMRKIRDERIASSMSDRLTDQGLFPEMKEQLRSGSMEINKRLQSDEFDTFYPYLSAKSYGAEAKALVSWASKNELASTNRFADRIKAALE